MNTRTVVSATVGNRESENTRTARNRGEIPGGDVGMYAEPGGYRSL